MIDPSQVAREGTIPFLYTDPASTGFTIVDSTLRRMVEGAPMFLRRQGRREIGILSTPVAQADKMAAAQKSDMSGVTIFATWMRDMQLCENDFVFFVAPPEECIEDTASMGSQRPSLIREVIDTAKSDMVIWTPTLNAIYESLEYRASEVDKTRPTTREEQKGKNKMGEQKLDTLHVTRIVQVDLFIELWHWIEKKLAEKGWTDRVVPILYMEYNSEEKQLKEFMYRKRYIACHQCIFSWAVAPVGRREELRRDFLEKWNGNLPNLAFYSHSRSKGFRYGVVDTYGQENDIGECRSLTRDAGEPVLA